MEDVEQKNPAQWAIDILEGKNYFYKQNWYNLYVAEISCAVTGLCAPIIRNLVLKRPIHTAAWQHVLFMIGGGICGRIFNVQCTSWYAKRDAILLDYVKKHPERFPEPQNRKYRDIFKPWLPLR